MKEKNRKRLYTVEEAGEYLGRSVWGIRELIYKGELPFTKAGTYL
jgi:excisionase family DNA binding protein